MLLANGYPVTFIDSCVNKFLHVKYTTPSDSQCTLGPEKKNIYLFLPYCGINSMKLKRQLIRLFSAVFPCVKLTIVFRPQFKLGCLSKLKSTFNLLSLSNVIYKINCLTCDEFYVGLTSRRLEQRIKEHLSIDSSALMRHSSLTGHRIDFYNPEVLATDVIKSRLCIKETLKIQELCAYRSLNGNQGSYELKLL